MATSHKITVDGKNFTINPNTDKKVVDALNALVKAMSTRQWPIGMTFRHADGDNYLLTRIKTQSGTGLVGHRAYLINKRTGVARNSRKAVWVIEPNGAKSGKGGGKGFGYVEDLPAEKDRFYDPDNPGQYIDC
jgi:hypothetical protein